jgi:palmitoyl-protein thioesterase
VNQQLVFVAEQLAAIPELRNGFDAIGFSQGTHPCIALSRVLNPGTILRLGGQFLRAFVERYNSPPVNNLITFGSQHMGVSDIPACRPYDFFCQIARRAAKGAVYSDWAQNNLIQASTTSVKLQPPRNLDLLQAQYFRDPAQLETYLSASRFLADINNELPASRNATYASNIASLNKLVLLLFTEDKTVVPKESAWFGSEDDPKRFTNAQQPLHVPRPQDKSIIPVHLHPLYTEDWIGIQELDLRDSLVFDVCEGEHMAIGSCWERIVKAYAGGRLT